MANEQRPFDPDLLAVALKYDREKSDAPVVSAKGNGYVAQRILELAQEHGIEIKQDADLALLLSKLELDMPIPYEAYAAVAEILAYVYKANERMKGK